MNIKQCSQKANALRVPGHSSVLQDGEGDGDLSGVQWPHDTRSIQQGPGIQMQPLGPQQDPALVNVGTPLIKVCVCLHMSNPTSWLVM